MNPVWHALLVAVRAATWFLFVGGLILGVLYGVRVLVDARLPR